MFAELLWKMRKMRVYVRKGISVGWGTSAYVHMSASMRLFQRREHVSTCGAYRVHSPCVHIVCKVSLYPEGVHWHTRSVQLSSRELLISLLSKKRSRHFTGLRWTSFRCAFKFQLHCSWANYCCNKTSNGNHNEHNFYKKIYEIAICCNYNTPKLFHYRQHQKKGDKVRASPNGMKS